MSKTIKLEESVYQELEEQLHPRDTFSEVVHRLICVCTMLQEAIDCLSGKKPLK